MKRFSFLFIALSACLPLMQFASCMKTVTGDGPVVKETRSPGKFHSLELALSATVHIRYGDEYSVEINGQQNILDEIELKMKNTALIIKTKANIINGEPVVINITMPKMESLSVVGSGEISVKETIKSPQLSMGVSGSGSIKADAVCDELYGIISGSGSVQCSGSSGKLDITINGSGEFEMENLRADYCKATVTGSGNIKVNVISSLEAIISGSGNIYYKGNPEKVNERVSGSGKIVKG